ncbi:MULTISPECIES: hypothetical protein [unclassified Streptomyces]|uniref:hypothetical protein n=1 Tax=unclassified Streptomyces TaxID=2593676 RepID=UPI00341D1D7E
MSELKASTYHMKTGAVTTGDVSTYVHDMIADFREGTRGWSEYAGTEEIGAAFRKQYESAGVLLHDGVIAYGNAVDASARTVFDGANTLQNTQNHVNDTIGHHGGKK